MALPHPGSVLLSKASETSESCANARVSWLSPGAKLVSEEHITAEAMIIQGAYAATCNHGDIWARLLLMTLSESMILPQ